ncbi:hypothetical protein GIB67_020496 [Kingdonia uniflora]|uniref:Protein ENHANCED DISEASE RESISTANCE 2 C-terminal domain-containing protein n=1 Tax=Kingdonia uniflora TaxID=39325 RepID=A0A7J7PCB2_9MAGN|nr:hypothetical protein GIB67_020496 [Kingdonia uniflora]
MAGSDGNKECDWTERVKSGGSVPHHEPDNCANGWATPSGDIFMVRGPEYFSTKAKISGGEYLLKPLGFDWIKSTTKIVDVLNNPKSRVRAAVENEFPNSDKPFIWAFNIQLPSKDNFSAVAYFVALDPIPEGSLMDRFLKGDDSFRNSRLKLIANIVKGPWIVRKAVGELVICLLGKAVSCKFFVRENYVEVDVDIGASMVASAIVHLAFGYITTLTVDLAFLIESQIDLELPEKILGAVRFSELNPASAKPIDPPSDENLQSSLPTGFWKSIGQGFSHFLHPNAQDSASISVSPHENGTITDKGSSDEFKKCRNALKVPQFTINSFHDILWVANDFLSFGYSGGAISGAGPNGVFGTDGGESVAGFGGGGVIGSECGGERGYIQFGPLLAHRELARM